MSRGAAWRRVVPALVAIALLVAAVLGWQAWRGGGEANAAAERPVLGLFTSLPILWGESADMGAMLAGGDESHWARAALDERFTLVALDTLEAQADGEPELGTIPLLLLAQPRPLAPGENVALDAWVREGGRVLLLADPALTWDSVFPIGDRRRPEDTVLLSPILSRWGLELTFDDEQPLGVRSVEMPSGDSLPVNLPGALAKAAGGHDADCTLTAEAVLARCRVGRGVAVVVADAALLEPLSPDEDPEIRRVALDALLALARD